MAGLNEGSSSRSGGGISGCVWLDKISGGCDV
jgi:hypothetical protein